MIPLIESNRWRRAVKPEDLDKADTDEQTEKKSEIKVKGAKDDVELQAVQEILQGKILP